MRLHLGLHWLVPAMVVAATTVSCNAPATPMASPTPPAATVTATPAATVAPTAMPATDQEPAQVTVEGVTVRLLESFPIRVQAVVVGSTPDSCTTVTGAETRRAGNRFIVTLTATRPAAQVCAQVITPFEHIVSLDVTALPGGLYTVDVHGITVDVILPDYVGGSPVIEIPVTYVLALVYAPIHTAQDASSPVVGRVAAGTVVRVTGKDPLGLWWRVVCPDNIVGDCWVSANAAVTQPTAPPSQP